MPDTILVVDDEASILESLKGVLGDEGYRVRMADSGTAALAMLREEQPQAVLLDIWMPGMDGIEALKRIREAHPDVPVIMMSGHGTIETAVRATKLGAYDFLEKPLSYEKIVLLIQHAVSESRLLSENRALRRKVDSRWEMIGGSPSMEELKQQIATAGPSRGRVLISGESGTGKELAARAIHAASDRAARPFVEVNCAAIPQDLIESELFGHVKGAFTGATADKPGKFEQADGGTIFLDEVGDMSLATQAKVLRVLQEQTFERVGGTQTIRVDVRVIAASNKDLQAEIAAGRFRDDLYFRLAVIPIHVPPLRERALDIPLLVSRFIGTLSEEYGKRPKTVSPEALKRLMAYRWPGNVREIKNLVERLVIMAPGPEIREADLPPLGEREAGVSPAAAPVGGPLREARAEFERRYILDRLRANKGNVSRTAEELEIERSNLHRKIKALGIEIDSEVRDEA
ncbi:MAG: sigma-54-dependent Fis family transcriptional regulator [Nitrospirae bacterium]|nr:sigma-54-dependent Fis family transcriptional regulator [Nitrospirota bacterium]